VTVSPDGTHAYVTNEGSNTVSVIDTATNTVTAAFAVGTKPFGVAVAVTANAVTAVPLITNAPVGTTDQPVQMIGVTGATPGATVELFDNGSARQWQRFAAIRSETKPEHHGH
jgi:YVTN family beta-propeller protein